MQESDMLVQCGTVAELLKSTSG